jgi:chromosome partitioning protein
MIVTVGNTKGGVGKTTLALNLAVARALQGRDVWLIDGDRQGTAQTAITIRAESGKQPAIACAHYPDGSTLRAQVQQMGPKFDDIIIDAGGRDSTALRAALILSDVLVVPFAPRSLDVWALNDISSLVNEARAVRDGLRVIAMLNNADPHGHDNEDAAAAVADFPELEYVPTPIRRRKPIANAAGQGMSILEYTPKDAKGAEEMAALVKAVFG